MVKRNADAKPASAVPAGVPPRKAGKAAVVPRAEEKPDHVVDRYIGETEKNLRSLKDGG